MSRRRILVALGGNALTPEGDTRPETQRDAVARAAYQLGGLVEAGAELAITHGNGPQVGNLIVQNNLARSVVPAVPLDWCVAQTQGGIGYLLATALEQELGRRGIQQPVVCLITRVIVDIDDRAWSDPSKPVGEFADRAEAVRRMGQRESWKSQGTKGWRRVVPSPNPREIVEAETVRLLLEAGSIVIAAGGGGIPVARGEGRLDGVEAVVDKDLTAALLAAEIGAMEMVIATDVKGVALDLGTGR